MSTTAETFTFKAETETTVETVKKPEFSVACTSTKGFFDKATYGKNLFNLFSEHIKWFNPDYDEDVVGSLVKIELNKHLIKMIYNSSDPSIRLSMEKLVENLLYVRYVFKSLDDETTAKSVAKPTGKSKATPPKFLSLVTLTFGIPIPGFHGESKPRMTYYHTVRFNSLDYYDWRGTMICQTFIPFEENPIYVINVDTFVKFNKLHHTICNINGFDDIALECDYRDSIFYKGEKEITKDEAQEVIFTEFLVIMKRLLLVEKEDSNLKASFAYAPADAIVPILGSKPLTKMSK